MSLGNIRKLLEVRKEWYKSGSEKLKIDRLKQKWKKWKVKNSGKRSFKNYFRNEN